MKSLSTLAIVPSGFAVESVIDGAEYGVTGYLHQAAFVELTETEILVACGGNKVPGEAGGDYAGAWTYLWRSEDGGRTFSEVETPFPNNAVNDPSLCTSNPTFVKVADDHLIMLARSATKDASESLTYVILSRDKGRTWGTFKSEGTDWEWTLIVRFDSSLDDTVPRSGDAGFNQWGPACFSGRPKLLKSGRIIFSLCASWLEQPPAKPSTTKYGAPFYYSDDRGETWDFLGGIKRPPTGEVICEPGVQELPDGRLLAIVRSYCPALPEEDGSVVFKGSRYYYFATSEDGGRNWSEPWPAYLGSERWNGALPDVAIVGESLYFLGNFYQFQPPDFPGDTKHWELGTQRTPLVLMQIPLRDVMAARGPQIFQPSAIRPVANTLTQELYLGAYASVQLEALSDGTLGVLCDTHTRSCDENRVLFWRISPSWFDEVDLALFRGPVPYVEGDSGNIRVVSSQTTVQNVRFEHNRFPVELCAAVTPHRLERRSEIVHPLLTILTNADLNVPSSYHPHSCFAAAVICTCRPKDGLCRFALNSGAGLLVTDVPAYNDRTYEVKLVAESRFWAVLYVDGTKVAEGPPICPALPGGFTVGHGDYPALGLDIGFAGVGIAYGDDEALPLAHPFLVDSFRPSGKSASEWRGALGNLALTLSDTGWTTQLAAAPWANWFRHGGCVIEASGTGNLFSLRLGGAETSLSRQGDTDTLTHAGKVVALPSDSRGRLAIAASALHERTYLVVGSRATAGIKAPLLAPLATEGPRAEILVGLGVRTIDLVAWDFPPAAALRAIEEGSWFR